jgi:hypothetical protein
MDLSPYTEEEIWEQFHKTGSITKHLLSIYSLAIGINAQRIAEIGIGSTTKTLRMAAKQTGGTVFSCDVDKDRFKDLLDEQLSDWRLFLGNSETFLKNLKGPIDLFIHDGAHDYYQVKFDLEMILPKMSKFGLICIHDTQQYELGPDMIEAIQDALTGWDVSYMTLPFCCGLTLIRIENCQHPAISPVSKLLSNGQIDTKLFASTSHPIAGQQVETKINIKHMQWVKWKIRKLLKGY